MKIKAILMTLMFVISISVLAQTAPQKDTNNFVDFNGFKGKIFELKNRNPSDLVSILMPLGSGFKGAVLKSDDEMKTLTVRDFPENIAAIEEALKRLDVPKPPEAKKTTSNIEVHLHALIASNIEGANNSYPSELNNVLKQLQATINYKNYYLLTSVVQRGLLYDNIKASGTITLSKPFFDKSIDGQYEFNFGIAAPSNVAPAFLIERFNFDIASAYSSEFGRAKVSTNLSIKDGEQVVVGTASLRDKALILVLSLKEIK